MGDDFRKVKAGDKFRMPARAYNAFIDAAKDFQNRQQNSGGSAMPGAGIDPIIVLVKNSSGSDLNRYAVLGINGPIYSPDDNIDSFKNKLAFIGSTPTTPAYTGKFAILLEPAKAGTIVRAAVAGVVPVQVDFGDANHGFADIKNSDATSLKSSAAGSAQVLWKQSGTGVKWALVRMSNILAGTLTSPATLGAGSEGSETASTDTWARDGTTSGSNYAGVPLDVWVVCRVVYNNAGDKKLYKYLRKFSFDALGALRVVSAETRVEVDAAGPCP